jgi:hypothetical protein
MQFKSRMGAGALVVGRRLLVGSIENRLNINSTYRPGKRILLSGRKGVGRNVIGASKPTTGDGWRDEWTQLSQAVVVENFHGKAIWSSNL